MQHADAKFADGLYGLNATRVREVISFDVATGIFRWIKPNSQRTPVGSVAGGKRVTGYIAISIDGHRYQAHRLAWLYVNGKWPSLEIDHINGLRSDNRIANLREASRSENQQNRKTPSSRKLRHSAFMGVSMDKRDGIYFAQIKTNGKTKNLGRFIAQEDAHVAYLKAKREIHPFNTI